MDSGNANLQRTTSNQIDSGASSGWDIADGSLFSQNSGTTWSSTTPSMEIAVKGALAVPLSLSDVAGGAVALSPAFFAPATTSYAAGVKNRVDRITVAPPGGTGATVAYLDGDNAALADADSDQDGFQVNLDVGTNTVKVKLTADDDTVTNTVVVTREAAAMGTSIWGARIVPDANTVKGYCNDDKPDLGCFGQVVGTLDDTEITLDGRDYEIQALLWDETPSLNLLLEAVSGRVAVRPVDPV